MRPSNLANSEYNTKSRDLKTHNYPLKPSDLKDSEYNLELTGFKRIVRSPRVATIVLTTSLLIAQQFIIEKKGNPDKRNIGTGDTSLPAPIQAPIKSEKPVQRMSIDTVVIPSIGLRNREIYNFLDRPVDENDTNETLYNALKEKINTMQSPEHNTQATMASIREEIRSRLVEGGMNSRALMKELTPLREEQERVEKLQDALISLQGPHDINKMNAAIATYHET